MKKHVLLSLLTLAALVGCRNKDAITTTGTAANPTVPASDTTQPSTAGGDTVATSSRPAQDYFTVDNTKFEQSFTSKRSSMNAPYFVLHIYGQVYAGSTVTATVSFYNVKEGSKEYLDWLTLDGQGYFTLSDSYGDNLGDNRDVIITSVKAGSTRFHISLRSDAKAKMDVVFTTNGEGKTLNDDLINPLRGAMKATTIRSGYQYDDEFEATLKLKEETVTTFEMSNPDGFYTDGYSTRTYDLLEDGYLLDKKDYVSSDGGKVATEYINYQNRIAYDRVYNSDDKTVNWTSSFYFNHLINETYYGDYFRSFDGGHTYHYLGDYNNISYLIFNWTSLDVLADDFFITVENGKLVSMTALQYPALGYDKEKGAYTDTYHSQTFVTTFSEIGTATMPHPSAYAHESYHDKLDNAINTLKNGKNYTLETVINDPDGAYKVHYVITADTIDQKTMNMDGTITKHVGVHKLSDSQFVRYTYHEDKQKYEVTGTVDADFNKQYVNFAFSTEIFSDNGDNTYTSRGNNGVFYIFSMFLPQNLTSYQSSTFGKDGTIALNADGSIKSITGYSLQLGDENYTEVIGSFSNIGTSTVHIDWNDPFVDDTPTTWNADKRNNVKWLYDELKGYKLSDKVPYLYNDTTDGYDMGVNPVRDSHNAIVAGYFKTGTFKNATDRDAFITSYQATLVAAGFTKTSTTFNVDNDSMYNVIGTEMYEKDGLKIGIQAWKEKDNLNPTIVHDRLKAVIVIDSPNIATYYNDVQGY